MENIFIFVPCIVPASQSAEKDLKRESANPEMESKTCKTDWAIIFSTELGRDRPDEKKTQFFDAFRPEENYSFVPFPVCSYLLVFNYFAIIIRKKRHESVGGMSSASIHAFLFMSVINLPAFVV